MRSGWILPLLLILAASLPAQAKVLPKDIAVIEDTDGKINEQVFAPDSYLAASTCRFYQSGFPDTFDAVFVFTTYPLSFLTNVQQGWPVKQDQKGIGRTMYNMGAKFCSKKSRLRQAVKMGDVNILPDDPDKLYTGILMYSLTGIELMGHEFGHHWLASVTFDKGDGVKHCLLRGYEPSGESQPGDCDGYEENGYNQHWSYYFDSRSLMYGSFIDDLGGGKFKLYYEKPKFSPLDQYLMGLRKPEEVGPLFVVQVPDFTGSASIPIQPGKSDEISGTRLDFTAEDIIRAEGPRQPAFDICHWKAAVILITEKGKPPSAKVIDKVVTYANRWEAFYSWATDGRGSMDLTIDGTGPGNDLCPSPVKPPPPDGIVADTAEVVLPPEEFPDGPRDSGDPDEEAMQAEEEPDVPSLWDFGPYPDPGPLDDASALDTDRPDAGGTSGSDAGKMCTPNESICQGSWVSQCRPDGSGWAAAENCDAKGLACLKGACAAKDSGVGTPSGCTAGSRGSPAGWAAAIGILVLGFVVRRRTARE
jgi:hypothetical protein